MKGFLFNGQQWTLPDGFHQTIHEKFVLFCWSFLPCIPNLAIATLHEPSLKVDRVLDERVIRNDLCIEAFKRCVEICDTALSEKTNEVEPTDGIFAFGRWERFTGERVNGVL